MKKIINQNYRCGINGHMRTDFPKNCNQTIDSKY